MEINYDLIIKYLTTIKNTFVSKKHILVCSDTFPDKFKLFLQNKFYRYGIDQILTDNFYVSLLILLNKHYLTYTIEEEQYEINKLKKIEITSNKLDIIKILDINLIIFDFKNENINILHSDEICNPYKPTLLIAQYENFYEPIINEIDNKKIFSYNDLIIKNIYQNVLPNKLKDNITELINEFKPLDNISEDSIKNKIFIKSDNLLNINESKLLKMTKKELQILLDNKNIKINISKMLKKDIVDILLKS
jgi:hypothetical protein